MSSDPGAPSPAAITACLEKALSSKTFVNSPQLCRLLRYLVEQALEGNANELKEYVLAVNVFRKDESFDPRVDNVVRTEARRLRQKLAEYYQSEGRSDLIEIVLAKGSYRATFENRAAPVVEAPQTVSRSWRTSWRGTAVSVVILIAATVGGYAFWNRSEATPQVPSIAVLPLENLSSDPEQEYFSDGMTDALCTDLAKIRGLSVTSRTSVMQYKRTKKPIPEIARELKVDYVLEGSITRSGARVRVNAQLIAAATDRHVWAESFERSGSDVLGLQGEIARAIASHVHIQLTPREQARLGAKPVTLEARDLYLKGRFNWMTRDTARVEKSIEYFTQAVAREPGYAMAYAGLSDSYGVLFGRTGRKDLAAKACESSKKALQLDDELGEAHAAMAGCADSWAWSERERELRRALELSPGYSSAHQWYGALLVNSGRSEEGLARLRRAVELDPLSPSSGGALGWALYITRQYDQAIAQNRQTLDVFPDYIPACLHLGMAHSAKGMHREAIAALEICSKKAHGAAPVETLLAHVHAVAGDRNPARRLVQEFRKREPVNPILMALLHLDTGEVDRAFESLAKAVDERTPFSEEIKVDPMYASLHNDPRWANLIRKMNLVP